MYAGELGAARLLLAVRANLDAQDAAGLTALHLACFHASTDDLRNTMADVLVSAGANVHIMDEGRLADWLQNYLLKRDLRQPAFAFLWSVPSFLPSLFVLA